MVSFGGFWTELSAELKRGKEFRTLKQSKRFRAEMTHDAVIVTPGTGVRRTIPKIQFQSMWNIMKGDIRNERYINTGQRYYKFWSSSYINALIDSIVKDRDMQ